MTFVNRTEAGRRLARALHHLRSADVVVLGLPRGGVPVAYEVARHLHAPLDVIVVRKLGVPAQPELAMGAIGEGGVRVTNPAVLREAGLRETELAAVAGREARELDHRLASLRGGMPAVPLAGRVAVVVDDGIATGATARAACQVARARGASRVVLAVPVAPPGVTRGMRDVADEVVCLHSPPEFSAVGWWYDDFQPVSDTAVVELLARAGDVARTSTGQELEVAIPAGTVRLPGTLGMPRAPRGLVVFAHGSGSGRHSPRNRSVARFLRDGGLGTLLFDLLDPAEAAERHNVFDVELLGGRLLHALRWLRSRRDTASLRFGLFGASTGAAAALWAAAEPDAGVSAIVSRGGRPDLAASRLSRVTAPTLLIVGGRDGAVLRANRVAASMMRCPHRVAVVPGATHLFEEPGALNEVAALAREWFGERLGRPSGAPAHPSGTASSS